MVLEGRNEVVPPQAGVLLGGWQIVEVFAEVGHEGVPLVPTGTFPVEESQQETVSNCLPAHPHFCVVVHLAV